VAQLGQPVDVVDQENILPMFEGSWTHLLSEGSEISEVEASDELSDTKTESSGSHDPNGDLIMHPQESVETFIQRVHGDDTDRILTGYQESPGLEVGRSIGSAESHQGASLPEVPSDAGRDSAGGDSDKENRPLHSPRSIRPSRPVLYVWRVLQSQTLESRAFSPEA
jgi:hypothetical protein